MANGTVSADLARSERINLAQRTSDPSDPAAGDEWLRVDLKPSYKDADGNTQTAVAEYRVQNADGTVSTAPVAQLGDPTGSNVIDKKRFYVDAGGSPTGKGFVPYASSGAKYPKRKLEHPAAGTVGLHDKLTTNAIPDSVTSRPDDDSTVIDMSYKSGVGIVTSSEWPSIAARISANSSGVSTAYLLDSNNNEIQSVDISGLSAGDTFSFSNVGLQSGETYAIAIDNDGSSHDVGFVDEANYPYTGPDLDITEGYVNGYDGTGQQPRSVNDIGNPDGVL